MNASDTVVAIATAAGAGGVGIVRLSGPRARQIGETVGGRALAPRIATYARFIDTDGAAIDDGIALYFRAPASFTGEDVVELQAHGSPVVLRQLVARCIALGARQATAGEFSQRAFLNGKLDLAQAEAIADLIAAGDERAARAARRSLDGVFSRRVDTLMAQVLAIRVHVERCYFHCARSVLRAGLWNPQTWASSQQVSFGKIIAEGLAQGPEVATAIDESVQGAYTTRLWSNKV